MRLIFFTSTSNHILLSLIFSLLLVVTDCSTTSELTDLNPAVDGSSSSTPTESTTPTTTESTTPMTTESTTPTTTESTPTTTESTTIQPSPPPDVENVQVVTQNESSISLKWNKVNNISTYSLQNENNGNNENVTVPPEDTSVTHVVTGLTAATEYNFTLFTVSNSMTSSGKSFTAVTAPDNVKNVTWVTQNTSSITLQWDKVNNISTYRLLYENNGSTEDVNVPVEETPVPLVISNLTAGTEYNFTIFTVFKNISSSGYTFTAVTTPDDVENVTSVTQSESSITLQWDKVNNISTYRLLYENNGSTEDVSVTVNETPVTHVVSNLTSGTEYSFTIFTVLKNISSSGYSFTAVTTPDDVENVTWVTQSESSITLQWDKVNNISTYRLLYENDGSTEDASVTVNETPVTHVVSNLTAGTEYSFTILTVFKNISSSGYSFTAVTTPNNVANASPVTQNETSVTLKWDMVGNILTYILEYEGNEGKDVNAKPNDSTVTYVVSGLTAGKKYTFNVLTVFKNINSSGYSFTAVTAPKNAKEFKHFNETETSITLQWRQVDSISSYIIFFNESNINVTLSRDNGIYTVSNLKSANRYSFSLFTVFDYAKSSGKNITAVTAPENSEDFKSVNQTETSITLQWSQVDSISSYIIFFNESNINVTLSGDNGIYTVSNLTSAEIYSFSLFTVFDYAKSSGKNITAVTAPEHPEDFKSVAQTEISITLQWRQVKDIQDYVLSFNNTETNITFPGKTIEHTISNLESGTLYKFKVFAVFEKVRSKEINLTGATVPPMVSSVNVTERFLNSAILEWEKPTKAWTYNLTTNGTIKQIDPSNSVSYEVSNLLPGTLYTFNVITMFSGLNSTAYNGVIVTKIDCLRVTWHVTESTIQGTVEGLFSNAAATNESNIPVLTIPEGKNVLFDDLYPGATYEINLEYKMNFERLQQCVSNPRVTIIPSSLSGYCEYLGSGYSALIKWEEPVGVWTNVTVNINSQSHTLSKTQTELEVQGLQPARTYEVHLVSLSGDRSSKPFSFYCNTDNRGVIAGSVMGVLILIILVCVAVLMFFKRPDIISRKKSFIAGSKKAETKGKAISVAKFPDHFYQLSLDENRGFSQEYEDLASVGTDQTRKAATLPENKPKNRFTNILPYDWCRVKLITTSPDEILDYINANYIPGYTGKTEYIASQGPLPSTLKDFWRMIWEQKIKRIVMVTNCTEAGRTKCECYWPEDLKQSCHYGEMLVTLISEQKESNWTLREFGVKNKSNSEERTVKHFHFTAWPDHGVPRGTEVLIQFRGLMRRHIESDGTKAPTVVHCSAGVGRTGTIIALDVMLQQLEKEGAVSINSFVHRMRKHRSHMVQTESQYIFLHQCIMDSLKQNEKQEENIYENTDTGIYVNATALREFHNHKSDP